MHTCFNKSYIPVTALLETSSLLAIRVVSQFYGLPTCCNTFSYMCIIIIITTIRMFLYSDVTHTCITKIICFATACDVGKVDAVYVLDVSLSIGNDTNFGLMRDLVKQSAQQLVIGEDDVLFSLILFARHANIIFNASQYTNRKDLIEAIDNMHYLDTPELNRTGTNIAEALDLVREAGQDGRLGLRPDATSRNVIFITDGRSNTIKLIEAQTGLKIFGKGLREKHLMQDEQNSIEAAMRLRGTYNNTFAIGITANHNISLVELNSIASRPGFVFEIEYFTVKAFQEVIQLLSEEICASIRTAY